ncbi:FAD-dependent monooxygenase [Streptosporangium sp. 'caverna']|uniref:FAD-dependent monooxygenase n=1 Tax=Streptosporangium sp. 'caverna' TaxID=2202249 RepID=UPI000D7E21B7|nr:FAD-dependent monooxygenase [Streptosporangium sp. 'caverna']AWS43652.1 salicylate 1-monooxygenase [Streptosporangium sp. 'caverna']
MVGSTTRTPRIAILGGGIGGLVAAAFLHRAGLPSTVYEQAPKLREVGAGLVVAPNAARLLRQLGVLETFVKRAVQLDVGWEFRRWQDGTVLSAEDLAASCERLYGEQTYTAHRADLLDAIKNAVPETAFRLGKRCVELTFRAECPVLRFDDGEVVEADIVIGADGIHSIVRNAIARPTQPTYSGICAFRALVPADRAPAFARRHAQSLWIGPEHHLVHYPVSAGEYVNLVAFAPAGDITVESWSATATVEEFLTEFDGWDPRLVDLIRAADTPGRWALLDRAPLDRWSSGPVTLLGDAAHPMFPFFGQGAAQAMEDAAVLARCIADDVSDPVRALQRYDAVRIPRTTRIQEISHARSHVNHLPDGLEQEVRDRDFAGADPLVANGWIYEYDPDIAAASVPVRV